MSTKSGLFRDIKNAVEGAPRNHRTTELLLQMIKFADDLGDITGKEFCEGVGIGKSFGTEFSKMRNLTERLKKAGLDVNKI